jgi:hypothetical protein
MAGSLQVYLEELPSVLSHLGLLAVRHLEVSTEPWSNNAPGYRDALGNHDTTVGRW